MISSNRFPPPWSVEEPDPKLDRHWCYIVRDANGHALAYVYFEDETWRSTAVGRRPDINSIPPALIRRHNLARLRAKCAMTRRPTKKGPAPKCGAIGAYSCGSDFSAKRDAGRAVSDPAQ